MSTHNQQKNAFLYQCYQGDLSMVRWCWWYQLVCEVHTMCIPISTFGQTVVKCIEKKFNDQLTTECLFYQWSSRSFKNTSHRTREQWINHESFIMLSYSKKQLGYLSFVFISNLSFIIWAKVKHCPWFLLLAKIFAKKEEWKLLDF